MSYQGPDLGTSYISVFKVLSERTDCGYTPLMESSASRSSQSRLPLVTRRLTGALLYRVPVWVPGTGHRPAITSLTWARQCRQINTDDLSLKPPTGLKDFLSFLTTAVKASKDDVRELDSGLWNPRAPEEIQKFGDDDEGGVEINSTLVLNQPIPP
ncbi:hypothetical protein J6590_032794 [Homalodisca vitripennis]|nr:hypothetical protein J6590_032794 [Homalodisca vitripennis]